jgi:hypothetical protein
MAIHPRDLCDFDGTIAIVPYNQTRFKILNLLTLERNLELLIRAKAAGFQIEIVFVLASFSLFSTPVSHQY